MDISVVLNMHREGLIAKPSFDSLMLAKAAAERAGIAVEVVVILDRPDETTAELAAQWMPSDWKKILVDFGDLGHARNEGASIATGKYVAFLDADDLFGSNWLQAAYTAAKQEKRRVVWHPEISIYFGVIRKVFVHADMDQAEADPVGLMCSNYWTALCFAPRDLLKELPYPQTQLGNQIGFEDWAWNQSVMAHGAIHKIVPGTGHLIRVKQNGSLMRQTSSIGCIPQPTDYYQDLLQNRKLKSNEIYPPAL
ncbi:MAG: glycosyltransferase family 2 protein [Burkholderiaceae bacterium]|jgi:glycosyltransferase involved in cell wall biosynthesis|nr:glycosyltransferase family 2 protein [Burkholderiaceae bacterium]